MHNVVLRSADGGYETVLSEERPGDAVIEPDPIPLDEEVELVPAMAGAPAAGNGLPEEPETLAATAGPAGERPVRGGIFRIPATTAEPRGFGAARFDPTGVVCQHRNFSP